MAAERAQLATERRRIGRQKAGLVTLLEPFAQEPQVNRRLLVVAGHAGNLGQPRLTDQASVLFALSLVRFNGKRYRLIEAVEHRQEPRASEERERSRRLRNHAVEPFERLLRGHGSEGKRSLEEE